MQLSRYEIIGEENIRQLIHDFYREVRKDELLAPMYDGDFEGAEERLFLFMVQLLGGPMTYSKKRGHPRLKRRHLPFRIDEEAKIHWLNNMETALRKSSIAAEQQEFLWSYFTKTAELMKNS